MSAAGSPIAADADDFILYNRTTGELFYDADGSGEGIPELFSVLATSPDALTESDFLVI